MPRPIGHDVGAQRPPQQRQVPGQVEHLVPDELVGKAQPRIQQSVGADHDRVVQRTAQRQAAAAQLLHVALEGEGPRRCKLLGEGVAGPQAGGELLVAEHRVLELDRVGHAVLPATDTRRCASPPANHDRADQRHVLARRIGLHPAGTQQDVDERLGRSVQDRHLGTVQLDAQVVDEQGVERRHEMLDRADGDTVPLQARGVEAGARIPEEGRNLRPFRVRAHEDDSAAGLGRQQPHADGPSAVQADPLNGDRLGEGLAIVHRLAFAPRFSSANPQLF